LAIGVATETVRVLAILAATTVSRERLEIAAAMGGREWELPEATLLELREARLVSERLAIPDVTAIAEDAAAGTATEDATVRRLGSRAASEAFRGMERFRARRAPSRGTVIAAAAAATSARRPATACPERAFPARVAFRGMAFQEMERRATAFREMGFPAACRVLDGIRPATVRRTAGLFRASASPARGAVPRDRATSLLRRGAEFPVLAGCRARSPVLGPECRIRGVVRTRAGFPVSAVLRASLPPGSTAAVARAIPATVLPIRVAKGATVVRE
jgi:hypothetical protein